MRPVRLGAIAGALLLGGVAGVSELPASPPSAPVVVIASPDGAAPVFPPPPAAARVRYVESIYDNSAFRGGRPWWKKVLGVFAGSPDPEPVVRPYGIEVAGDAVWVCDPGAGVVHGFRRDSTYVRVPRTGRMASPIDAAVDTRGRLHVTDSIAGTVTCFDGDGRPVFQHEGAFERPTGISYHAESDRVFVVDTQAHRVLVQSADGARTGSFGARGEGDGQLNFPTAIHAGPGERLYVTDAMNFRVQVFDGTGAFVTSFGRLGDAPGSFSKPKGVATDPDGNVWVVDAIFDAVQIFAPDGALLLSFGGPGQAAGQFWLPSGVAVDPAGRVYVADSYNHRVQVFQYIAEAAE